MGRTAMQRAEHDLREHGSVTLRRRAIAGVMLCLAVAIVLAVSVLTITLPLVVVASREYAMLFFGVGLLLLLPTTLLAVVAVRELRSRTHALVIDAAGVRLPFLREPVPWHAIVGDGIADSGRRTDPWIDVAPDEWERLRQGARGRLRPPLRGGVPRTGILLPNVLATSPRQTLELVRSAATRFAGGYARR